MKDVAAKKTNPWSGDQGGGHGRGRHGGPAGQGQPPPHQTGGGLAGGDGRTPGDGPPGKRYYGVKKPNTSTHKKVKAMLEPLQGRKADTRSLIQASKKRGGNMRNLPGRKEGDPVWCPEWTLGGCHNDNCKFMHENASAEYVTWICEEVKPGAEAILVHPVGWRAPDMGRPGKGGGQ